LAEITGRLSERDRRIANQDSELANKDRQMAEMTERLAKQDQELARMDQDNRDKGIRIEDMTKQLGVQTEELCQLRRDIAVRDDPTERSALLVQTQEALRRANDLIKDRDIELLKLQNQMLRDRLESEASRRQRDSADVGEKMANLERLFNQVSFF
jgi:hypothetical protein